MAVTESEEALAQRVVEKAKSTAHVDTGALKRSINYTVARGHIVFRQLFYGQFHDNSKLIQYANSMMKGIPYTIEELDEEGNVYKKLTKAASGRASTSPEPKIQYRAGKNSSLKARALIDKLLNQRRKYVAPENNEEDN